MEDLLERAGSTCELCGNNQNLSAFEVSGSTSGSDAEISVLTCDTCHTQLSDWSKLEVNHWHCLSGAIWSEAIPVKVLCYRILSRIKDQGFALDLLEQIYLEEKELLWAKNGESSEEENSVVQKDSNGNILNEGDSVTLIKDLDVKGAGFTAKRGTLVKNIMLTDDPGHIEGKVSGVQIVLVTKFLKKVSE